MGIADRYGGSITLDDLLARTDSILNGSYVPGGSNGTGYATRYNSSDHQTALVNWSDKMNDILANDGRYNDAFNSAIEAPGELRTDALDAFLRDEGIVLHSQSAFDLNEAFASGAIDSNVEALFTGD